MIEIIHRVLFIFLIAKLLMTMYQRRFTESGGRKRLLSLYQSLFLGVVYGAVSAIITLNKPESFIYSTLIISIVTGFLLKKVLFPYVTKCESCGKKLSISQILFIDDLKCEKCRNLD